MMSESGAGAVDAGIGSIQRTPHGWRIHGEEVSDLLNAIVLADLLAAEEGSEEIHREAPARCADGASEVDRLRTTVAQLEYALYTRVVVEQAVGVLAERHRLRPRQAFERLRAVARSRSSRVADIAGAVVRSSSDPLVALPDELAR